MTDDRRMKLVMQYAATAPVGKCFRCSEKDPDTSFSTFGAIIPLCFSCRAYFGQFEINVMNAFPGSLEAVNGPSEEDIRKAMESPQAKQAFIEFKEHFDSGKMFPHMRLV